MPQIAIATAGRASTALSGVQELHNSALPGEIAQNLPIAYRISPDGSGSREILHRADFNRAPAIAVVCLALLG
jgi:hypothetical protein